MKELAAVACKVWFRVLGVVCRVCGVGCIAQGIFARGLILA